MICIPGWTLDRCEKAEIEYENYCEEESFGITDVNFTVFLPSGRKKREVQLWDIDDLEDILSIEFEKYIIVGNYLAICNYEKKTVEAAITVLDDSGRLLGIRKRRILKSFGLTLEGDKKANDVIITSPDIGRKTIIKVGRISKELAILTKPSKSLNLSITIKSNRIIKHADAVKILEKVSNALFFEIEIKNGIALTLQRDRQKKYTIKKIPRTVEKVEFPKYEYDSGPISLYWYARSAVNMPLLQFLAFYQAIEFYFPVYFKIEINRKIKSIIKDHSFKIDRDSDVSRITSIITSKSYNFGSEKEQLKATLKECVDEAQLEAFIFQDKNRKDFFSSKQKGITSYTINLKDKNNSIVNQVAERIYDIRCKVVHVKSDHNETEFELLLPYTEEAERLYYDIELVQFIAQRVLIYSSTILNL